MSTTERKYPRVVLLKSATWPGSGYKAGRYYYLVGETTRGGMMLQDEDRPSREGERAVLLGKSPRGGAVWFLGKNVRPTRSRTTSTRDASRDPETEYRASFVGRQRGAIGKFYRIATTVTATSPEEARLRLYDRYEHIQHLKLVPKRKRSRDFTSKYTGKKRRLGHTSLPFALDAALSDREMRLRKAAQGAAYGERHSIDEPREPNPVEDHYLRAIDAFKSRRPTLGYDLLERGDHRALLRYGRQRRARARGGRMRQQ